ncbi:alpha/beta hydrolase [Leifsonia shinshuensis]|uniref:alpha/beta fold hydrolase n=1 Tax=Leifsonia shinshuensis TaxID=150026 RepID=UPI001F50498A|nr:alpha/beta hydrolase [Leifsonia shinshuensis]MCI0156694.1 alpha/beta hydrolase [Leifsonia shinshuensis]
MPFARNGDIRLHYDVRGSGLPLLFIPGLGVSIADMAPFVTALAGRVRVIAVDNRGAGLSDKPDEPYSIAVMAADAIAVAEDSGLAPLDVLGYSLGGRIALQLAADRPHLVRRLVLLSTSARVPLHRRSLITSIAPHIPIGAKPRQPAYAFRRQRAASEGYDARSRLATIVAPTLVLAGPADRIATPSLAEELHEGIPNSRLEWYTGGHRTPMMSGRAAVAETIASFLGGGE